MKERAPVAVVGRVSACTARPARPLRVSTIPWPNYESVHLAQSLGYLDPALVRVDAVVTFEPARSR